MTSSTWTLADEAKLLKLIKKDPPLSYTSIGKMLGKSKNACVGKANRLKQAKPPADRSNVVYLAKIRILPRAPLKKIIKEAPIEPKPALNGSGEFYTILNVQNGMCRFPNGQVSAGTFYFCANPTHSPHSPWCAFHAHRLTEASKANPKTSPSVGS